MVELALIETPTRKLHNGILNFPYMDSSKPVKMVQLHHGPEPDGGWWNVCEGFINSYF
jgi:hypothetical protein